jgi:Rod binding domain-containing protein
MNTSGISSLGGTSSRTEPERTAVAARPAGFNAAALRQAGPAEQRRAVAAQFEAILVRQLLGPSMASMLGGSTGGVAGSVYGDLLADTISQQLTAGPGLGLGRYIERQLAPRAASAGGTADQSPAKS